MKVLLQMYANYRVFFFHNIYHPCYLFYNRFITTCNTHQINRKHNTLRSMKITIHIQDVS